MSRDETREIDCRESGDQKRKGGAMGKLEEVTLHVHGDKARSHH